MTMTVVLCNSGSPAVIVIVVLQCDYDSGSHSAIVTGVVL